ncbi:DNA methyltransferase [Campylobacter portucalensis]|uniref:DNA methyltransferase n=1 Tax=Campylobacter portucalensis TaxID=2608384 RepID=UPI001E65CE00|nr:DNA methyltransferase [Campylobacter portucalensis]
MVKLVAGEYKLHKKVYSFEEQGTKLYAIIPASIGRTEIGSIEIKNILNRKAFNYPKPEPLIKYFIEISTQPNDIVMDFFLGSGTTAAVAHKMNI